MTGTIEVRDFELQSSEGLPLRGVLHLPERARAAVILVHGFKGFKQWGFFPWIAEQFATHGFAAIRFDMSRSGIGHHAETFDRLDLFRDDTYSIQIDDLHRVAEWATQLRDLDRIPLILFGHSRGGAVAILAAQQTERLRCVVTWSAIASTDRWDDATKKAWRKAGELSVENSRTGQVMPMSPRILDDLEANRSRLDVLEAAKRIAVPLLVVHGGRDESVSTDDGRAIAGSAPNSSLLIVESGTHTFGAIHPLVHIPEDLSLANDATVRFIGSYVR
ncbi:MAG: alpha/beta fold hydrolase [Thermoanaerobaculia bacterium]